MSDQTPATPVEAVSAEPVVENQIIEEAVIVPAEPVKVVEDEDSELGDDDAAAAAKYWKSMSRKNEAAMKKALEANKALLAENDTFKSELGAIKHESVVASVLSEYGLPDGVRALLHGSDPEALKAQAAALVELRGGTIPTPVAAPVTPVVPVVAETPRVINPFAGLSDVPSSKGRSFGDRFAANMAAQKK